MQLKKVVFTPLLLLITISFILTSCGREEISSAGELEMQITDAPSDDASVKGVFVTIAEIKVDGKSYQGFQGKQTIDIMAYQNGQTKILGLAELEAGTYSNISLVLDTETDANGNTPACYVLRANNEKENLVSSGQSTIEIASQSAVKITNDATSTFVIDFDLRKAVQYKESNSQESSFSFVSEAELNSAIRVVEQERSGNILGSFEASLNNDSDKVVVYAYKKGSFNKEEETKAKGDGKIQFSNAITSAAAIESSDSFSYQLSFLEEGDYEICLVAYEDADADGEYTFEGFLDASVFINGSVTTDVSVSAGVSSALNLSIIGIIQ